MSKRKDLTAEPNVKIEDIMAAREGRRKAIRKAKLFAFVVIDRSVSHGEDLWNKRNRVHTIEIAQNSHSKSKSDFQQRNSPNGGWAFRGIAQVETI